MTVLVNLQHGWKDNNNNGSNDNDNHERSSSRSSHASSTTTNSIIMMAKGGVMESPTQRREIVSLFASLCSSALCVSSSHQGGGVKQPLQGTSEQLLLLLAPSVREGDVCVSVPSLAFRQHPNTAMGFLPKSSKPLLEDVAASNLGNPTQVTRSDLQGLPLRLLWNLSRSFIYLVDSRMRSLREVFVNKQRHQGADAVSAVMGRLLEDSNNPISPTTIVTTLRTLAFSEQTEDGVCVLPLVFEATFDMNALGIQETVSIEAPGTIQGRFSDSNDNNSHELVHITITLDTSALLRSMMVHARTLVRKTTQIAVELSVRLHRNSQLSAAHSIANNRLWQELLASKKRKRDAMNSLCSSASSSSSDLHARSMLQGTTSSSSSYLYGMDASTAAVGSLSSSDENCMPPPLSRPTSCHTMANRKWDGGGGGVASSSSSASSLTSLGAATGPCALLASSSSSSAQSILQRYQQHQHQNYKSWPTEGLIPEGLSLLALASSRGELQEHHHHHQQQQQQKQQQQKQEEYTTTTKQEAGKDNDEAEPDERTKYMNSEERNAAATEETATTQNWTTRTTQKLQDSSLPMDAEAAKLQPSDHATLQQASTTSTTEEAASHKKDPKDDDGEETNIVQIQTAIV